MEKRSMFVGMDVHKESIDISVAEEGRQGEVRRYGVIAGDLEALAKVVRALRAPDRVLHFDTKPARAGLGFTATSRRRAKTARSSIRRACPNGAAIGSRPTSVMATPWSDCTAPASSRRSTFRRPMMKPCMISCARVKTPSA